MTMDRKPLRYAHSDGHTDVCYSEDGTRLVTCGTDGDIRIWSGFEDDDPLQTCVGEWSLCVRQKGSQLFVATDNNSVQVMTFPEAERDVILMRFTAHVNHMAVGKDHDFMAVAAEDMEVRLINLAEPKDTGSNVSFTGLNGPPLSVALSPKAKMLAVSCGDGLLRVWDTESTSLLQEFECVPKANSFMNASLLCRIDFEPGTGRSLAYPHKNTVVIVHTADWSTKLLLMCLEVEASYSIVQFSPCGNLMAAASDKGDLVVWNIASQSVIDFTRHQRSFALCAMVWNPLGNGEIAFCDVQGQLGIAVNCVNYTGVQAPVTEAAEEDANEQDIDFTGFQFEDDDDEDNENVISLEKLKNSVMPEEDSELNFDGEFSRPTTPRAKTPEVPMQEVFMPTSTPKHLSPRYLCWNDVGIIRSYGSDESSSADDNKTIEVEFHDATFHTSMMLQNFQNYSMGSLSTAALVVASSSHITAIPLGAGAKEWSVNLNEEEEIVCIACSNQLVCFATASYLVRVWSVYGTQKAVFSIPGPLVCMNAHGYSLLIAYHSSAPRQGDQCIRVMLVKLEGMAVESRNIESAIKAEAQLLWLGFTDVGTPAMQDSSGMLYLYPIQCNLWLPFCDTAKHTKNPTDGFFVTAVFESLQAVRGIRCRGSIYPGFATRPTLSELPLESPFVEMATEKSQLEANLFTWSMLQVENVEKKFKETALKTFALACKNDLDQRALELVEMMANPQLIALATKYAAKLNKRRLAEKLSELACNMQENDYDDQLASESTKVVSTPALKLKPITRKLVLNSGTKRTPKNRTVEEGVSTPEVENADDTNGQSEQNNTGLEMSDTSIANTTINTQDSIVSDIIPKNPFLKSLRKSENAIYNPLSLTDKSAGCEVNDERKKEKENGDGSSKLQSSDKNKEKRKKPDSDAEDKQKSNKQRRLDKFIFSKQSR